MDNIKVVSGYENVSHTLQYGLGVTFPLVIAYFIGKTEMRAGGDHTVLTTEVIIRKITTLFGTFPPLTAELVCIALLSFLYFSERERIGELCANNGDFLLRTLSESSVFAAIMVCASIVFMHASFFHVPGEIRYPLSELPKALSMKSGAGFLEEFLFRLVILGGILKLFQEMRLNRKACVIIALGISSFAFAEMHSFLFFPHLGVIFHITVDMNEFIDPAQQFAFRFASGLFLGTIYIRRGFGTSVWTHAIYGYLSLVSLF